MNKKIKVVAAVMFVRGKVMVAGRRVPGKKMLWEFPGGKMEKGETRAGALSRELIEELGIKVNVVKCLGRETFSTRKCSGEVIFLRAVRTGGRLRRNDREEVKWVKPDELAALNLLPADRRFVRKMKWR